MKQSRGRRVLSINACLKNVPSSSVTKCSIRNMCMSNTDAQRSYYGNVVEKSLFGHSLLTIGNVMKVRFIAIYYCHLLFLWSFFVLFLCTEQYCCDFPWNITELNCEIIMTIIYYFDYHSLLTIFMIEIECLTWFFSVNWYYDSFKKIAVVRYWSVVQLCIISHCKSLLLLLLLLLLLFLYFITVRVWERHK